MEAPRSRNPSRHALLSSALVVLVIGAGVTVLFVARNADGRAFRTPRSSPRSAFHFTRTALRALTHSPPRGAAPGGQPRPAFARCTPG